MSKCNWFSDKEPPKDGTPILAIRHNGLFWETPIVVSYVPEKLDKTLFDYPFWASPYSDKEARYSEGYFTNWQHLPEYPEELEDNYIIGPEDEAAYE